MPSLNPQTVAAALRELNDDQRRAALLDERRCLILAGPGAGKTRTIIAKAHALCLAAAAAPHQIAMTTFTNHAAQELRERLHRLGLHGVHTGTVHHLARSVLRTLGERCPAISDLANNRNARVRAAAGWLREALVEQPDLLGEVYLYHSALRAARAGERRPHYALPNLSPATSGGAAPGAREARTAIALLLLSVQGTRHIPAERAFAVPEAGPGSATGRIVIGDADVARIATSPDPAHTALERLGALPGALRPSPAHVDRLLRELNIGPDDLAASADDALGWLSAARHGALHPEQAVARALHAAPSAGPGALALARIACALMKPYFQSLARSARDDHQATIARARRALRRAPEHSRRTLPWRRLFVDEWQDVNRAQSHFLHALAETCGAHLTVVGDHFQAVFGFQGGDTSLTDEFIAPDAHAVPCHPVELRTTYRLPAALARSAHAFIVHGLPVQDTARRRKLVASAPTPLSAPTIQIGTGAFTKSAPGRTEALAAVLEHIARTGLGPEVMVLARRRATLYDIAGTQAERAQRILRLWTAPNAHPPAHLAGANLQRLREAAQRTAAKAQGCDHRLLHAHAGALSLRLSLRTMHGAKGSEADAVIIVDDEPHAPDQKARERRLDDALAPLRPAYRAAAEQRRLWYVAITRARRRVYLLMPAAPTQPSELARELAENAAHAYDVGFDALRPPARFDLSLARTRTKAAASH